MRLLIISSEFPPGPGGIGTHAWQISKELHRLGSEVVVATAQDYAGEAETRAFAAAQPFDIERLPSMRGALVGTAQRWGRVAKRVRAFQPEILVGTGDRMIYLTAALARWFKLPWVAVEHGRWPGPWEVGLKRRSLGAADGVVSVSQYSLDRLVEMGVKPRRVVVINNGADPEVFRLLPPTEVDEAYRDLAPAGGRWLITVGTLSDRKGQDVVIRALPELLARIPNVHYLCVGLPQIQPRLSALAKELGVQEHVHFAGAAPTGRLVGLLNGAEVFVLTSRRTADQWEGFGVAVVEAALCGKPAVVSKDSGLAEAIMDGVTGLGVPENDPRATAAAIGSLLENPARCREMGATARLQALAGRTWSQTAGQYEAFLRTLPAGTTRHAKPGRRPAPDTPA